MTYGGRADILVRCIRGTAMKAFKVVLLVLGAVIALTILAGIAVVLLVKPNDFRDDIARAVERSTGRHLAIDGDLHLRFFPWLAIEVDRVALGNPPGFGDAPFIAAQSLRVGVRLMPLLSKRLEVSRVAVDGLEANLLARADGRANWQGFGSGEKSESGGGSSLRETKIAGLDLTHARIRYRDEAKGGLTRVEDLELHAGELGGGSAVPLQLKLTLDSGPGTGATQLSLEAKARLTSEGVADIADLALSGEQRPAAAAGGKPLSFELGAPRLVLDMHSGKLDAASLQGRVGGLPLTVSLAGEQLFGERVLSGDLTIAQTDLRTAAPALGVELPKARDATAFARFSLSSRYRLTTKALELSGLELHLDETSVRGRVAVTDLEAMSLAFDLDVDHIDVDRYSAPPAPAAPGGAAKPPTALPLEALRKPVARGEMKVGSARLSGLQFSAVRLPLDAQHGLVHLGPTAARLFGGAYNGNIVLDARGAQAHLSVDEHVRDIDLGALVKASFKSERFSGRGDANAKLEASGTTDAALYRSLAGRVDVNVRDGALVGRDLWYEIRRARALFRGEAIPAKSGPDRTAFRALSGSAVIAGGVARNDDLKVDLDYLRAHGAGTLTLATQAIDYHLTGEVYRLPPEGTAGSEMADLKALEIPLTITGTIADYKVRPDFQGLAKAKLQQKLDEKKQELRNKVQDQLGEKLKGLFGR
jgi:AsmA protein